MNLMTGKRYEILSTECKKYIQGLYGCPAGTISEDLKKSVLEDREMVTVRPGSLLEPGWERAKAESAGFARCEEDVLTYAMFPEAGAYFLKKKYQLS